MEATKKGEAVIIGGGIIGLTSAYYLLKDGWKVTILDKGEMVNNCSYGNAGMIVPSHFVPLAAPGMLSKGIKWMFNSRSPFYVKPTLDMSLLSWGLKFIKSATAHHVERSATFLRDYHLFSKQLYQDLEKKSEFGFGLETKGILMLYKTEKAAEEEIHTARDAQKLGLEVEILHKEQVQELEPHTALNVMGAVHYRCDAHLFPNDLMSQLLSEVKRHGGVIKTNCDVVGFDIHQGEIKSVQTRSGNIEGDLVVMTGGCWLPELAKMAGLNIPVMPGKGYSFMEENTLSKIIHPSLLIESKVAVTPMGGQVRFGGTMEIAPVNDQINSKRVEGIVRAIPRYYTDWNTQLPEKKNIWYGFRPCSPDGLPYLGYSKKIKNLIVAGGHGMMGISMGPATGMVVSELAGRKPTSIAISIYDPQRFE